MKLLCVLSGVLALLAVTELPGSESEFYRSKTDGNRLFQKDLDIRQKIEHIRFEFGGGMGSGIYDRPLYNADTFAHGVAPIFSINGFAGIRIIPGIFETIELSYCTFPTITLASNNAGTINSRIIENHLTLTLAYLLKTKFFQINSGNAEFWNYIHLWAGIGPIAAFIIERSHTLTNGISVSDEKYTNARFGYEAVIGGSFSLGESPLSVGLQIKYTRLLAAPAPLFRFSERWDLQPQTISCDAVIIFNSWSLE